MHRGLGFLERPLQIGAERDDGGIEGAPAR
jgi:hypothetical protein